MLTLAYWSALDKVNPLTSENKGKNSLQTRYLTQGLAPKWWISKCWLKWALSNQRHFEMCYLYSTKQTEYKLFRMSRQEVGMWQVKEIKEKWGYKWNIKTLKVKIKILAIYLWYPLSWLSREVGGMSFLDETSLFFNSIKPLYCTYLP